MIRRLHAKNYGCLKDVVTPELGPIHAFIGPNDSGKSTILRAAALASAASGDSHPAWDRSAQASGASDPLLVEGTWVTADVQTSRGLAYYAIGKTHRFEEVFGYGQTKVCNRIWRPVGGRGIRAFPSEAEKDLCLQIQQALAGTRVLRLDPDALRRPSGLIPGRVGFLSERGDGLPGVYDAIVNRGDDAFQKIRAWVISLFPTIRRVGLRNVSAAEKVLEVELLDGTVVPAELMSEGLLYFLAFVAIEYLETTAVVLVEEPENGLHPSRIADVVRVLRAVAGHGTQVLIATHSPLVVNELREDEVTVVTRDTGEGTRLTLLRDTPHFEERSKVYALGELWLSYADGVDEAPLLSET